MSHFDPGAAAVLKPKLSNYMKKKYKNLIRWWFDLVINIQRTERLKAAVWIKIVCLSLEVVSDSLVIVLLSLHNIGRSRLENV